jgi:toxin ParE1/3/4
MAIIWSASALCDILNVEDYIVQYNPAASLALTEKLVLTIETMLTDHPAIGRSGRAHETRELVIPDTPYIAAYRIKASNVEILRVLHGAREWPKGV